ncbi:hypothetical protein WS61_08040 [Burkholderia sp. ABCPW 11]|nr:hypothetical protein WS61_08040 [Burkholderia sp. ABCPW 11]
MLKANSGGVKELIAMPVQRPRDYSQVNTPEFIATKARLEAPIHPKEAATAEDDGIKPHMIRMTDVAVNVEQRGANSFRHAGTPVASGVRCPDR